MIASISPGVFTPMFIVIASLSIACSAAAQDLTARINNVRDGLVRFAYASRSDVCGDGERMIGWQDTQMHFHGSWNSLDDIKNWRDRCVHGPLRVTVHRSEGRTVKLRVMAGPQPRDTTAVSDLGVVSAASAVKALMTMARSEEVGGSDVAITASALADSVVVWPELLTLARDPGQSRKLRAESRQWLAWLTGDRVLGRPTLGEGKKGLKGEKTQAVFVLAELPRDEGIPDLIRIARTHSDPDVRRSALFWLGQKNDPRALDLFEELLKK